MADAAGISHDRRGIWPVPPSAKFQTQLALGFSTMAATFRRSNASLRCQQFNGPGNFGPAAYHSISVRLPPSFVEQDHKLGWFWSYQAGGVIAGLIP